MVLGQASKQASSRESSQGRLKREFTEKAHRESTQREHTEESKQAGRQAGEEGSRQALGVYSVGAMPWRGLLFFSGRYHCLIPRKDTMEYN